MDAAVQSTGELKRGDLKSGVLHLRSITGLRFIAAFVVFWHHAQACLLPGEYNLPLGNPAVSFFFVLSGFVLTYVYAGRLTLAGVPRFWFSRWARLWPLHIVCLGIALYFGFSQPGNKPNGSDSWLSLICQIFLVQSWLPIRRWFLEFNAVSWSISTELFFYLAFPLLLLGKRKLYWTRYLMVGLVSYGSFRFALYLASGDLGPTWISEEAVRIPFPLLRIFEFATGIMACLLLKRIGWTPTSGPSANRIQYIADSIWELVAAGVCVAVWFAIYRFQLLEWLSEGRSMTYVQAYWVGFAIAALSYAALICTFASRQGVLGQWMASRTAVWLGEISFAFYLIHQVIVNRLNMMTIGDSEYLAISFLLALFSAAVLYRVVEMPCRNGLVALFDRKNDWWSRSVAGVRSLLTTRMGLFHATVLVALLTVVWFRNSPPVAIDNQEFWQIANATPPELRGVQFSQEARLTGCRAERTKDGVDIVMTWKLDRSWSRSRFLHICNSQGNLLRQTPFHRKRFVKALPYEPFFDRVSLDQEMLKDAAYVAVGFWSPELQCTQIGSPLAEMDGCRLKIVDLTLF